MPPKRKAERSLGDPRLDRIQKDLDQLRMHWDRQACMSGYKKGFDIIDAFNEAIRAVSRKRGQQLALQIKVSGPCEEDRLVQLFATEPRFENFMAELDMNRNDVVYFDTTSLRPHDSMTFLRFCVSFQQEDDDFKPVIATQTKALVHPEGLQMCSPRAPKRSMFPSVGLCPAVVFSPDRKVTVENDGVFMPPHIAYSSIGTLRTTSRGWKLFVTWPPTEKNLDLVQHLFLRLDRFPDRRKSLELVRKLEHPRFNYLDAGDTMYVAAGHICATMAAYPIGEYQIHLANPAVDEWDDITRSHNSRLNGVIDYLLDEDLDRLDEAIRQFQHEHDVWMQVTGLPQRRTAQTVARTEIEWFERKRLTDLQFLKDVADAKREGREDDVRSLVTARRGVKVEDTPEPDE